MSNENALRVILTAGYGRAPHVLAIAEQLQRKGHDIAGIIVVSPFSAGRLKRLIQQRGLKGFQAAIDRLLSRHEPRTSGGTSLSRMQNYLREHRIPHVSLRAWANENGVPFLTVKSLNSRKAIEFVRNASACGTIYGGGGILHNPFIEASGRRILNAHSGPLPEIRGMNACEWSVLLGLQPHVTIHFIDRGIDTGGIVAKIPVPLEASDTIASLRDKCVVIGVEGILNNIGCIAGTLPPGTEGKLQRQCFILAPALKDLLTYKLAKRE